MEPKVNLIQEVGSASIARGLLQPFSNIRYYGPRNIKLKPLSPSERRLYNVSNKVGMNTYNGTIVNEDYQSLGDFILEKTVRMLEPFGKSEEYGSYIHIFYRDRNEFVDNERFFVLEKSFYAKVLSANLSGVGAVISIENGDYTVKLGGTIEVETGLCYIVDNTDENLLTVPDFNNAVKSGVVKKTIPFNFRFSRQLLCGGGIENAVPVQLISIESVYNLLSECFYNFSKYLKETISSYLEDAYDNTEPKDVQEILSKCKKLGIYTKEHVGEHDTLYKSYTDKDMITNRILQELVRAGCTIQDDNYVYYLYMDKVMPGYSKSSEGKPRIKIDTLTKIISKVLEAIDCNVEDSNQWLKMVGKKLSYPYPTKISTRLLSFDKYEPDDESEVGCIEVVLTYQYNDIPGKIIVGEVELHISLGGIDLETYSLVTENLDYEKDDGYPVSSVYDLGEADNSYEIQEGDLTKLHDATFFTDFVKWGLLKTVENQNAEQMQKIITEL